MDKSEKNKKNFDHLFSKLIKIPAIPHHAIRPFIANQKEEIFPLLPEGYQLSYKLIRQNGKEMIISVFGSLSSAEKNGALPFDSLVQMEYKKENIDKNSQYVLQINLKNEGENPEKPNEIHDLEKCYLLAIDKGLKIVYFSRIIAGSEKVVNEQIESLVQHINQYLPFKPKAIKSKGVMSLSSLESKAVSLIYFVNNHIRMIAYHFIASSLLISVFIVSINYYFYQEKLSKQLEVLETNLKELKDSLGVQPKNIQLINHYRQQQVYVNFRNRVINSFLPLSPNVKLTQLKGGRQLDIQFTSLNKNELFSLKEKLSRALDYQLSFGNLRTLANGQYQLNLKIEI